MTIQRIEPGPRLSRASIHNGTVYLCGIVATESGDIRAQTGGCLAEVDRLLRLAGTTKSRALQVLVHFREASDDDAVNEVYDAWIDSSSPPSRTSVICAPRRSDALVEFTVIAAK